MIGGLLFRIASVGTLVAGVYMALDHYRLIRERTRSTGTIVGFVEDADAEGGTTYAPTVSFTIMTGAQTTFTSRLRLSANLSPRMGDTVEVVYLETSPGKAEVLDFRLWLIPLMCLVFAALSWLVAILMEQPSAGELA